MCVLLEFDGHVVLDRALDRLDILARTDAGAVADAEDMGVDRLRGIVEPDVQHHIRGLAPHPRQAHQRGARGRHLATEALDEDRAELHHVLRLLPEQADGLDVLDQPLLAEGEHLCGRIGDLEQAAGGLVHPRIRRLRRERHGDEQGEGVGVLELPLRVGLGRREPAEHLLHGFIIELACHAPFCPPRPAPARGLCRGREISRRGGAVNPTFSLLREDWRGIGAQDGRRG
ncbi:hypothetical protein SDC9_19954 [bioreactor metagenome]|uniref:Uncharacterized protein n=1 Tax=bioreactor metagenome TaxID=1076179 RepID=A0A644U5E4_9ZZZZ